MLGTAATESYTAAILNPDDEEPRAEATDMTEEDTSRLQAIIDQGRRMLQASWQYQWLTTEPEPNTIVIDVRDSQVVGPLIAIAEQIGGKVSAVSKQSRTWSGVQWIRERLR